MIYNKEIEKDELSADERRKMEKQKWATERNRKKNLTLWEDKQAVLSRN